MPHAIRFHRTGGPEVLQWEEVELAPPQEREVRVRHRAIGLNFIDVYHRNGLYPMALPSGIGQEGSGVVEAVGSAVTEFKPGDRVAYPIAPLAPIGSYSEVRNIRADKLLRLPDQIDFTTGAAMMLQGLTAHYLLRRTYRVKPGDTILFHAAAGGVGLIACQWAKALGATVIGTAGSDAKAELARAHGCDHVIVYTRENFVARVKEITGGTGVPVVYDSVGRDTFQGSLECLQPFGLLASFGNSSGPVPPFDIQELSRRGSLYLTRATLFTHLARRETMLEMAGELFEVVQTGKVKIQVRQSYPLREAAEAHRDLEARKTTGSAVLLPCAVPAGRSEVQGDCR